MAGASGSNQEFTCRVCGLKSESSLWSDGSPSDDVCPCCGVQTGYGDTTVANCIAIRSHWIKNEKCRWSQPKERPAIWDVRRQLNQVEGTYRGEDDEELALLAVSQVESTGGN